MIVPWNDLRRSTAAFAQHGSAAILSETVPANMGVVPPAAGFLELCASAPTRTARCSSPTR